MFVCFCAPRSTLKTIINQHNLYSKLIRRAKYLKIESHPFENVLYSTLTIHKNLTMDIDTKILPRARRELLQIFDAGVSAVLPSTLINDKVKLDRNNLIVNGESYPITENVYLVGFGKAVAGMAFSLENLLGTRLKGGIISVPRAAAALSSPKVTNEEFKSLRDRMEKQQENLKKLMKSKVIKYLEGAENNQPDAASLANTQQIVELVQGLQERDTLLVLVSGGGSALLFQPKAPLTMDMKRDLCRKLQNAGASITELNCVRKQLSTVKGGGLAKIAYPAKVIALVLSDIVGDPLDFIASGPTCPEGILAGNQQQVAIDVLKKYKLYHNLENDIRTFLTEQTSTSEDNSMLEDGKFKHVENVIIGNNESALQAAKEAAIKFDLESLILTNIVEGDVKDLSIAYSKFTKTICTILDNKIQNKEEFLEKISKQKLDILKISQEKFVELYHTLSDSRKDKGLLLLAGGEPTVIVEGSGKGGRNQELALRFSLDWLSQIAKDPSLAKYFVLFLSAGTDGQDGPTDAAGAFGQPAFRPKISKLHQDIKIQLKNTVHPKELEDLENKLKELEEVLPENVLKRNDSYNFYSKFEDGRNLVKTGLTGTNVMDLHFIYIRRRDCDCDFQIASHL